MHMTNQDMRTQRINELLLNIKKCDKQNIPCEKDKLIAIFGSTYGLNPRKVREYLSQLILTNKIIEDDNCLFYIKQKEDFENLVDIKIDGVDNVA
jgi:hypothetical protein